MIQATATDTIKIFYADDDPDDLLFFSDIVRNIGFNCQLMAFHSGIQLLENLNIDKAGHNIVFLDVNMPRKTGLQCLKDIRDNRQWDPVPVYMISTSNEKALQEQAAQLGARGYIEKPSDYSLLKNKIKEAITSALLA